MVSLISDFDGTLFFHEESPNIRKEDQRAIKKFQENNKFGLCTGRSWGGLRILEKYNLNLDFYIVNSGAMILNKNKEVVYEKYLENSICEKIIEEFSECDNAVVTKDSIYWIGEPLFESEIGKIIQEVKEVSEPVVALSLHAASEHEAYEIVKKINAKYDVQALQNEEFVDVAATGCSKAVAIQYVKDHLDSKYVAAIGDSYNDIDMLKRADHSFTFEKSPKHVKNVSDEVVSGIAEAIEKINDKFR